MKRLLPFIPILCLAASTALAFRLPGGVYRLNALKDAEEKAKKTNKPITFVYTDEDTTCPYCEEASLDAMKSLKLRTVVVYVHANKEWDLLPPVVKDAVNSPEAGKYIPITVIVDADMKKVNAIVPYAREKRTRSKLFREAMKKF